METKTVNTKELKSGDRVKIAKISGSSNQIFVSLETKNPLESKKETFINLKPGATLIFRSADPKHFNDYLFFIPGFSDNVEVWISDSTLQLCELTTE